MQSRLRTLNPALLILLDGLPNIIQRERELVEYRRLVGRARAAYAETRNAHEVVRILEIVKKTGRRPIDHETALFNYVNLRRPGVRWGARDRFSKREALEDTRQLFGYKTLSSALAELMRARSNAREQLKQCQTSGDPPPLHLRALVKADLPKRAEVIGWESED